jgi:hypothetical protein
VTKVAVVAHAGKSFGGGLMELRRELERFIPPQQSDSSTDLPEALTDVEG